MTDPYTSPPHPTEGTIPTGYPSTPASPPTPRYGEAGGFETGADHDDETGAREKAAHLAGTAKDEAATLAATTKDEAADLASTAKDAAGSVLDAEKTMARDTAAEAADRAKETFAEAKVQVSDLWQQSRTELSEGAGVQLQRLSTGARSIADELSSMASASDEPGIASDVARRASGYLSTASEWLENRGPEEVLSDVKQFARRSPGTFIAIAAGLGLVAGRVTRSLRADAADTSASTGTGTGTGTGDATPSGSSDAPTTTAPVATSGYGVDYGTPPAPVAGTGGYAAGGTTGSGLGATPGGTDPLAGGGLR